MFRISQSVLEVKRADRFCKFALGHLPPSSPMQALIQLDSSGKEENALGYTASMPPGPVFKSVEGKLALKKNYSTEEAQQI
jgi:hypothetical protein